MKSKFILCSAAAVLLVGCAGVPHSNVSQDRLGYAQVIADSWKSQTLLNVVRLRYADAPVFLDVASVINSYSVSAKMNSSAQLPQGTAPNVLNFGGEGSWSNTPTVTYQPVMGDRFTRSMLQPVPPVAVFQLIQSGWPVALVLRTMVGTISGLRNESKGVAADPGFLELVEAMNRIQRAGNLGIRVDARGNGTGVVVVLRRVGVEAEQIEDARRIRELLGVPAGSTEFEISYGLVQRNEREVSLLTRSMLELLLELGFGIDLPASHITDGRAIGGKRQPSEAAVSSNIVKIHSGPEMPKDSYAAVPYRGNWYWIDDTDVASKSTFTFLLILFSLAETGPGVAAPVVTVPSR
jgi:hypothetical protein